MEDMVAHKVLITEMLDDATHDRTVSGRHHNPSNAGSVGEAKDYPQTHETRPSVLTDQVEKG